MKQSTNLTTATVIRGEARRLTRAGCHAAALELLDNLMEPAEPATETLRGKIYGQLGKFDRAVQCFRRALSAESNNEEATRGLASAQRLAHGPMRLFRLRARGWFLLLLVIGLMGILVWKYRQSNPVSNKDLSATIAVLERKVEDVRVGRHQETELVQQQIEKLQQTLQAQTLSSEKFREELTMQLRRLQSQIGEKSAIAPLSTTQVQVLESLQRIENALKQTAIP